METVSKWACAAERKWRIRANQSEAAHGEEQRQDCERKTDFQARQTKTTVIGRLNFRRVTL